MEENVRFDSGALSLAGILNIPDGLAADDLRPAILVLHGFGSNKNSGGCIKTFSDWGYVTVRFDMRGCGESDGELGHILCLDQVEDTRDGIPVPQALWQSIVDIAESENVPIPAASPSLTE